MLKYVISIKLEKIKMLKYVIDKLDNGIRLLSH